MPAAAPFAVGQERADGFGGGSAPAKRCALATISTICDGSATLSDASSHLRATGKNYEKALQALISTKGRLNEDDVDTALKKAGLDPGALRTAFEKDQARIDGILARNMDQANAFGFGGTPAFLVNTRVHHGAMNKQALRDSITAARKG